MSKELPLIENADKMTPEAVEELTNGLEENEDE